MDDSYVMVEYLQIWGHRKRCFHILVFHCIEFDNKVGQDRSKTGYKAQHPNQFIFYPVKKLIIANRDDENCLHYKKKKKKEAKTH